MKGPFWNGTIWEGVVEVDELLLELDPLLGTFVLPLLLLLGKEEVEGGAAALGGGRALALALLGLLL